MSTSRRQFLAQTLASTAIGWTLLPGRANAAAQAAGNLHLAPFRFDVTPPMGHSLCGGWITPVEGVDDPLEAIGFVLLGAGKPIVLCAVDWTGLLNSAHIAWRDALAEAAGTTPDRVAVQCVHQHNAPFACLDAEALVLAQGDLPDIVDPEFFQQCLERGQAVVKEGLKKARPVTHVAHGQGKVEKVASNRRVSRNPDGTVKAMRGSSCGNETLRAMPEGLIDPWLKTVAFYDQDEKIASCHYYATHPMSYYGDGRVSSDFAGLARKRRQAEEPNCTHLYFTGCAGNIAAGKYNDGSKQARIDLTQRMYDGIVASEATLSPKPIESIAWRTADLLPPPNAKYDAAALAKEIGNHDAKVVARNRSSYTLAWLQRLEKQTPIILSSLALNDISLLHLPAECFIQYQLRAQKQAPDRFVATASYGDGGPWYIPTKEEYPLGGYECSVAFCAPEIDNLLAQGMTTLLG
ncbi:MAG: hypothetical protein L3K26_06100 [Candidatus Hydrogenedentes bacterium]|nr:hypothetical protein [Candidatus Hydrogenedentota bacterium]